MLTTLSLQAWGIDYSSNINPGLNDAWFNPETSGQGFFITVFPELNAISLAWFTYDTELPADDAQANLGDPGHRWMTAVGPISGNQAIMQIEMVSGGIFDTATQVDRTDPPGSDGTIILTFNSCNSGTVEYDIPSINRSGTVPIQRVASDNIALCEALWAQGGPQTSGSFTVVSYNVGALPPLAACCDPKDSIPEIGDRIAMEDYDLVAYQEIFVHATDNGITGVGSDFYDELMGPGTPHDYQFPPADEPTRTLNAVASGLGRISRFPFDVSGDLPQCEDAANDRTKFCRQRWDELENEDAISDKGYSFARHEITTAVYLDVYNWHAQAGGDAADERADNTAQLISEINFRSQGNAVIVLGDGNSTYDRLEDTIRSMLTDTTGGTGEDDPLKDVWLELVRGPLGPPIQGGAPLFPCDEPDGPAAQPRSEWAGQQCEWRDKIFYRSSDALTLTPTEYFVRTDFINEDGDDLSDHYPIGVVFDYQALSGGELDSDDRR